MRLTRTSITSSRQQPKRLSHVSIKTTVFYVGMRSVNPFIERYCILLRETTHVWLLQLYLQAVQSINFLHSSRKVWRILKNLSDRLRHFPRPVSADAIVSQLVRNERYEAVDHKSSRLVSQEVLNFGGHNTRPSKYQLIK